MTLSLQSIDLMLAWDNLYVTGKVVEKLWCRLCIRLECCWSICVLFNQINFWVLIWSHIGEIVLGLISFCACTSKFWQSFFNHRPLWFAYACLPIQADFVKHYFVWIQCRMLLLVLFVHLLRHAVIKRTIWPLQGGAEHTHSGFIM